MVFSSSHSAILSTILPWFCFIQSQSKEGFDETRPMACGNIDVRVELPRFFCKTQNFLRYRFTSSRSSIPARNSFGICGKNKISSTTSFVRSILKKASGLALHQFPLNYTPMFEDWTFLAWGVLTWKILYPVDIVSLLAGQYTDQSPPDLDFLAMPQQAHVLDRP